jgi:WD40 repeat protein
MKPLLHLTADDSDLTLAYSFWPAPNPIRCSTPAPNPVTMTIDLVISVSNTDPVKSVSVDSIVIGFPLGQDTAAKLSGNGMVPEPILMTPGDWDVRNDGADVKIKPKPTTPQTPLVFSGNPLVFRLPGIVVNTKPGKVSITIEQNLKVGNVNKKLTGEAWLEKQPNTFAVISFSAEPAAVDDLDKPTRLKWICAEAGNNRSYRLHGPSCTNQLYTCSDGASGVEVTPGKSTIYSLDVIGAQGGSEVVEQTLYTPVEMAIVSIERNSHLNASPSGRIVAVGWRAHNARRCSVSVNKVKVEDNAPADTYSKQSRYELLLSAEDGAPAPDIEVVAVGATGAGQSVKIADTHPGFKPPVSLQISGEYNRVRIAPTGNLALLIPTGFSPNEIIIADLVDLSAQKKRIHIEPVFDAVFSSDGKWLLVSNGVSLIRVDVASGQTIWTINSPIAGVPLFGTIALAPDDKRAFVVVGGMAVIEIELPSGKVLSTHPFSLTASTFSDIARSADGKKIAVIRSIYEHVPTDGRIISVMRYDLHLIDLNQTPPATRRVYVADGLASGFSMTPDARLAVAVERAMPSQSNAPQKVCIIDLNSGQVDRLSLEGEGFGAAILSNGRTAIIATRDGLKLVDIDKKTIKHWGLVHGRVVAISPTHFAVVAGHSGVFVI